MADTPSQVSSKGSGKNKRQVLSELLIILLLITLVIFFLGVVVFSGYIVFNSGERYFSLTVGSSLILTFALGAGIFIYAGIKRSDIKTLEDVINAYFDLQVLVAVFGFIQTILWVLDPTNENHEPRASFILALSAFLLVFRSQVLSRVARFMKHQASRRISSKPPIPYPDD